MAFEIQEIVEALSALWQKRPPHLHRVELLSTTGSHSLDGSEPRILTHWRVDLACHWEEDKTLEERLAEFGSDSEARERFVREKDLAKKSPGTVVGKRQYTECKHLYFDAGASVADVARRSARAVVLLTDMARWQPVEAHHREIDVDDFADGPVGPGRVNTLHVSQLSHQRWDRILLLPADYERKPLTRVSRASLPAVPR